MKNWSLNSKIALAIGILVTGSLIISYLGLKKMSDLNAALNSIVEDRAPKVSYAHQAREILYLQLYNERSFILEDSKQGMEVIADKMKARHEEVKNVLNEYRKIASEDGKKNIQAFETAYTNWWKNSQEVQRLSLAGSNKEAIEAAKAGAEFRKQSENVVDQIIDRNTQGMDNEAKRANELYSTAHFELMAISASAVLFGVTMAVFILIAVGKSINHIISALTGNSDQVAGAARQIATSSEQLSQASTEQASSLEETVAALEELTSMVQANSNNAKIAADLSRQTKDIAIRGEKDILGLVESMNHISADSKKIEEIISVIDDIAFQTNLLALNAAVEAARAGEQGKGFAVVAEAVRSLAQRSSSAAKDITDLIKSSVSRIEGGSHQADQGGRILREIVESVNKVSSINSEIATSSEEQSTGISQIGKAMNQLDQVTQVNAATSEEAAASAEELSAQSESLNKTVNVLVETIKGRGHASKEETGKVMEFPTVRAAA